jgi:hypothetical protein
MSLLPGGFRQNETMQHGQTFTRRIVTTLLLSLALGVRAASAGSISIQWDANPEPDVVGYRLFIGTLPGVYSSSVDVGNKTSYVFNAAAAGQRYCFAVAAYSAGPRLGDKSVEVCSDTSGNQPPTLTSPGNQTNAVGAPLTLTLDGSDPDNTPVTYSATGLPTGLTLNSNTGFISGTPTTVGTYSTHATVSDGSLSMTQAFTWKISASLPGAASPLRPSGSVGTTTPTFEWESVATATSYRLWVDDASTTDPKIQIDVTPTQAGCTTTGAVCHVSPGVALAVGRASWSVRASNASGAGPWSGALDFTVADSKAPTISIIQPTSAAITTSNATIDVGGKASDDAAVTLVTWTNNLGGSGTAAGTNIWMVTALPLKVGANILTFTARDAGGNIGTTVLTVTKADAQKPALSIQSPTTAATYSTANSTLTLSGSASDDGTITQVSWVNDRGGSGTAAGTTAWSIGSIVLKPGANVIAVTARDNAGNMTTQALTATLTDSEAPTVTIGSPTAATTYSTGNDTVALGGTAMDSVGVTQVSWASDRGGSGIASGTTAWMIPSAALKAGANVITVTARDAAGNAGSDSIVVTMTVDTKAPVVTISGPTAAAGYSTNANSLVLGGTASDDVALAEVAWSNSQGGAGVAVGTSSWSIPAVTLKPGLNTLTVTARDTAGNTASAALAVRVTDVKAPTVTVTGPSAAAAFSSAASSINLEGISTDDFGVTRLTWVSDRGASGVATVKADGRWIVGGITLQAGVNVLTVTAADAAGNTATDVARITYDRGLPTISLTSPTTAATFTTSSSIVALAGTAADDSGIARVTWATDKGQMGDAVGTTAWTIPAVTVPLGTTVVTVTAHDNSGNATALTLSVVNADTAPPTVKIYTPTTASTMTTSGSTVTLAGTATDNVGVTRVTWATDGGANGTAYGTASWSTGGIALTAGTTSTITVTARDAAGNSGVAVFTVTALKAASVTNPTPVPSAPTAPASSSSDRTSSSPVAAPVVRILTPTPAHRFSTTNASVSLSGVASHAAGISVVRWMTDRGDSGVADGTSKWTVAAIPARPGRTIVTVTAATTSGEMTSDVLTVVRPNPLPKLSLRYPMADSQWTSGTATVTLKGTATENVTRVLWSSESGATGVADGTTGWTIAKIGLQEGVNRITLTAQDADGRTDRQVLKITYRARTVLTSGAVQTASRATVGLE